MNSKNRNEVGHDENMREELYFLRSQLLPKHFITSDVLTAAPEDDENPDNTDNNDDF